MSEKKMIKVIRATALLFGLIMLIAPQAVMAEPNVYHIESSDEFAALPKYIQEDLIERTTQLGFPQFALDVAGGNERTVNPADIASLLGGASETCGPAFEWVCTGTCPGLAICTKKIVGTRWGGPGGLIPTFIWGCGCVGLDVPFLD